MEAASSQRFPPSRFKEFDKFEYARRVKIRRDIVTKIINQLEQQIQQPDATFYQIIITINQVRAIQQTLNVLTSERIKINQLIEQLQERKKWIQFTSNSTIKRILYQFIIQASHQTNFFGLGTQH